jgi:hypothetical protein
LDSLSEIIRRFVESSREPVVLEAGEDPIALRRESFVLTQRGTSVTLECWTETRNLARRIRSVKEQRRGRLELEVERFPNATGKLTLADLAEAANRDALRRGSRLKYRERFRRSLRRQFPDWRIAELSTEPDLHHSLSPSYPRALLRKGRSGMAAIGAGEDALAPEGVMSFGLIWLDHLRRREPRIWIETLAVFVPADAASTTCHRVRYLNPELARYLVYVHDSSGHEDAVDPRDYTNFDTRIDVFHAPPIDPQVASWLDEMAAMDGVERRYARDGRISLAVRGLEFASVGANGVRFGIDEQQTANVANLKEIRELARGLQRMRSPFASDRQNPLYTRHPEAWLESEVRRQIQTIDATIDPAPIYGQVPQFAGGDRGVIDLLAIDRDSRLTIVEVKASQDIQLPLQALDYWLRVKWHLERGEFSGKGYFPQRELSRKAPRLLLISPALEFHPSNETVLRYLSREVETERIGVGVEWRQELRVMFRVDSAHENGPSSIKPG